MSGTHLKISALAFVDERATIGPGTEIAAGAWVGPGAEIGADCKIETGACVGYGFVAGKTEPTVLGDGTLVASGAVVYHSTILGKGVKIRHNATVRENVQIGDGTNIGSGSNVEHHTSIGRFCSLHTHVHITDLSIIGDYVFIGPCFASFSDINLDYRRPQLHQPYRGINVGSKARIGGRVSMLPGSKVGEETVIGACSVVYGEMPDRTVCLGNPARPVKRVPKEHELTKFD